MQNFIFDIDGTLIDTEKMYIKPLYEVLIANGYQITYAEAEATFGITAKDALEQLNVINPQQVLEQWNRKIPDYQQEMTIFEGIPEALAQLNETKKLAIATSKLKNEFERDFTPIGLNRYFHEVVTSDEVKKGKPAPDMILKGLEKLAAEPKETVYVGDTVYDLKAAHNAGVYFALAGWRTPVDTRFKQADFVLQKPIDMVNL
ncbi:HAD family hydrolase [Lentilactobacillus kribbianus]|uniref:HAD family hydrolase n=1 Tax=Lentilactobacillus kribbianus TaxID=2729622 RepID=UPI0015546E52|nr:HAD family hydrolase [Lentilactobacillus kribbianus]